jgi:hypothetical protein
MLFGMSSRVSWLVGPACANALRSNTALLLSGVFYGLCSGKHLLENITVVFLGSWHGVTVGVRPATTFSPNTLPPT